MIRDFLVVWRERDLLLSWLSNTIVLSLASTIAALALGALLSVLLMSRRTPLRWLAGGFVDAQEPAGLHRVRVDAVVYACSGSIGRQV